MLLVRKAIASPFFQRAIAPLVCQRSELGSSIQYIKAIAPPAFNRKRGDRSTVIVRADWLNILLAQLASHVVKRLIDKSRISHSCFC